MTSGCTIIVGVSYRIYFVGVLNIGEKLNKSPIAKIKSSPINLPVRYALVGGTIISIRDRCIYPFTSLCQRIALSSTGPLLCSENVAIDFKTSIEAYFVEKKKR